MIREQIRRRRKVDAHIKVPLVAELSTIKALCLKHSLYIMFVLYTEGGLDTLEIQARIKTSYNYVQALLTTLRKRGLIIARFKDARSQLKMYFVNTKNVFLVSILSNLESKYGKVVLKGITSDVIVECVAAENIRVKKKAKKKSKKLTKKGGTK
jgi:hypothetical protein